MLKKLFQEDQNDRIKVFGKNGTKNPSQKILQRLKRQDKTRIKIVHDLLNKKLIKSKFDLYYAAMILQHSTKSLDYRIANQLSEKSLKLGYKKAAWLYAATLDRFLMSQGKKQRFGTQYYLPKNKEKWKAYPIDPKTTDNMRKKYGVPTLKKIFEFEKELNK